MGKRILITAPVHQSEEIFKEYLNSLDHLIIPENYIVNRFFYLHNNPELKKFLSPNEYLEIKDDTVFEEHQLNTYKKWKPENYFSVAYCRTLALEKAREEKYDYIFSVDSDILLHPNTLKKLLLDNKLIVSNVSFTKINNNITPNCWEFEGYNHYKDEKFFYEPNLYPVNIVGQITLINSKIFNNKNINYYSIDGVDNTFSEDYAFCLKVFCNFPDSPIWIDTTYPARHLYHQEDYNRWIMEKKRYE